MVYLLLFLLSAISDYFATLVIIWLSELSYKAVWGTALVKLMSLTCLVWVIDSVDRPLMIAIVILGDVVATTVVVNRKRRVR